MQLQLFRVQQATRSRRTTPLSRTAALGGIVGSTWLGVPWLRSDHDLSAHSRQVEVDRSGCLIVHSDIENPCDAETVREHTIKGCPPRRRE